MYISKLTQGPKKYKKAFIGTQHGGLNKEVKKFFSEVLMLLQHPVKGAMIKSESELNFWITTLAQIHVYRHNSHSFSLIPRPGFPGAPILIVCSMKKPRGKTWRFSHMHSDVM